MKCAWHTCNEQTIMGKNGRQRKFCTSKCKNKYYVDRRRKKLKQMAVEHGGGGCQLCSYNKCTRALEFHHLDPAEKDFSLSATGTTKSWIRIKAEIEKCILVCANCHREIHAGISVPRI